MGAQFIPLRPNALPPHVLRRKLEAVILDAKHLLCLLDEEEGRDPDPTEDMEPDDDADPVEIHGEGDELEDAEDDDPREDDGTAEPILGAPERHPYCGPWYADRNPTGAQTHWWAGRNDALNDGEHDPGYDLGCASEHDGAEPDEADAERTLGWNETVSQLALGAPTDDGDATALERHGKGFIPSGHDDAEDGHDGERDEDHGSEDSEDIGHYASRHAPRPLTAAARREVAIMAARAEKVRRTLHV